MPPPGGGVKGSGAGTESSPRSKPAEQTECAAAVLLAAEQCGEQDGEQGEQDDQRHSNSHGRELHSEVGVNHAGARTPEKTASRGKRGTAISRSWPGRYRVLHDLWSTRRAVAECHTASRTYDRSLWQV